MKAEVEKLKINKMVNVLTALDNLKTKAIGLDVDKLKIIPVDLRRLSHVVCKEVVKLDSVAQTKYESK